MFETCKLYLQAPERICNLFHLISCAVIYLFICLYLSNCIVIFNSTNFKVPIQSIVSSSSSQHFRIKKQKPFAIFCQHAE